MCPLRNTLTCWTERVATTHLLRMDLDASQFPQDSASNLVRIVGILVRRRAGLVVVEVECNVFPDGLASNHMSILERSEDVGNKLDRKDGPSRWVQVAVGDRLEMGISDLVCQNMGIDQTFGWKPFQKG